MMRNSFLVCERRQINTIATINVPREFQSVDHFLVESPKWLSNLLFGKFPNVSFKNASWLPSVLSLGKAVIGDKFSFEWFCR